MEGGHSRSGPPRSHLRVMLMTLLVVRVVVRVRDLVVRMVLLSKFWPIWSAGGGHLLMLMLVRRFGL